MTKRDIIVATIAVICMGGCIAGAALVLNKSVQEQNAITAEREANGGALPGIEAANKDGVRYDVDKFTFEGTDYICFKQGRRMGCVKDD